MSSKKKYVCKKCKYKFANQGNLTKHLNRTVPCDKKVEYKCKKCQSIFTRECDLKRHKDRKTSCVVEIKDTSTTSANEENKCKYCGNKFSSIYSLKRHYTSCKAKKNPTLIEQKLISAMEQLQKRDEEHAKQINRLEELIKNQQSPIVNNIVNNDNRQLNIQIVCYGSEQMGLIKMEDVAQLFIENKHDDIIPNIVKLIHGNPEHPENHNVYVSQLDSDHAMVYRSLTDNPHKKDWQIKPFDEVSHELTEKAKSMIEIKTGIPKHDLADTILNSGW